jgi:glycosyltransferase involved in cell wall biosynthesis
MTVAGDGTAESGVTRDAMSRPLVSVVICTRNRAGRLAVCLNSLGEANRHVQGQHELLVVDNNSTDGTKEVVEAFARTGAIAARYMFEREPGAAAARNCGLAATRGDLIAITDDDCVVDVSWFREIEAVFSDGDADMIGGRVELYDKADRVGGFDVRLGPGTRGAAAEDIDFIYRAFLAGFAVRYDPRVLVFHNHGRRTEEAELSLKIAYIRGRGAWYAKHLLLRDWQVVKLLYWEFVQESGDAFCKTVRGHLPRAEFWYLWNLAHGLVIGFAIFLPIGAFRARRARVG